MAGRGKIGGRKPVLRVVEGGETAPVAKRLRVRSPMLPNGLTVKQETFCQSVASGENLSAAYRKAFDASNMKDATIWSRASVLAAIDKVKARIDGILADKDRDSLHDSRRAKEWIFKNLQKIVDQGESEGAKVAALQVVAKMHALLTDRQEVETSDARTTAELREELASALATLANPPRRRA